MAKEKKLEKTNDSQHMQHSLASSSAGKADASPAKSKKSTAPEQAAKKEKPLPVDEAAVHRQLFGGDPHEYFHYSGKPMSRLEVERELKNPHSLMYIHAAHAMVHVYVEHVLAVQLQTQLTLADHIRRLWRTSHTSRKGRQPLQQRAEKVVVETAKDDFFAEMNMTPETIELRNMLNATEDEVNTMLNQFEGYDRQMMAYSLDAARQLDQDFNVIETQFDAMLDAAVPAEREMTQEVIEAWQTLRETQERHDAQLLEQPDVAAVVANVPVCWRECKRNINKELTRNNLGLMMKSNNLQNTVVETLMSDCKTRDNATLKNHVDKGLRQFKVKAATSVPDRASAMNSQLQKASVKDEALIPVLTSANRKLQHLTQQAEMSQHRVANDIYASLPADDSKRDWQNDVSNHWNAIVDEIETRHEKAEQRTPEQQSAESLVLNLVYRVIDEIKEPKFDNQQARQHLYDKIIMARDELSQRFAHSDYLEGLQKICDNAKFMPSAPGASAKK